jgi:hypothetical protein
MNPLALPRAPAGHLFWAHVTASLVYDGFMTTMAANNNSRQRRAVRAYRVVRNALSLVPTRLAPLRRGYLFVTKI